MRNVVLLLISGLLWIDFIALATQSKAPSIKSKTAKLDSDCHKLDAYDCHRQLCNIANNVKGASFEGGPRSRLMPNLNFEHVRSVNHCYSQLLKTSISLYHNLYLSQSKHPDTHTTTIYHYS